MSDYTARLDDWFITNEFNDTRIKGAVSGDGARRFFDGEIITTSPIETVNPVQGDIVKTRSGNHYFLGSPKAA